MNLFFDMEFTGLHQNTTPVSLGIVSEGDKKFYAEFTDYADDQVDSWIQENVINKLRLHRLKKPLPGVHTIRGDRFKVRDELKVFLTDFSHAEFWSDVLSYDWVLLCQLFGGAMKLPKNVYTYPFDIATLMKHKNIDPDINREKFAFGEVYAEMLEKKHNALWDAEVIKACYEKLK